MNSFEDMRDRPLAEVAGFSAETGIIGAAAKAEMARRVAEAQIASAEAAARSARHTRNSVIALVVTALVTAVIQFFAWRFPIPVALHILDEAISDSPCRLVLFYLRSHGANEGSAWGSAADPRNG